MGIGVGILSGFLKGYGDTSREFKAKKEAKKAAEEQNILNGLYRILEDPNLKPEAKKDVLEQILDRIGGSGNKGHAAWVKKFLGAAALPALEGSIDQNYGGAEQFAGGPVSQADRDERSAKIAEVEESNRAVRARSDFPGTVFPLDPNKKPYLGEALVPEQYPQTPYPTPVGESPTFSLPPVGISSPGVPGRQIFTSQAERYQQEYNKEMAFAKGRAELRRTERAAEELARKKRNKEALKDYEEAIKNDPDNVNHVINKMRLELETGRNVPQETLYQVQEQGEKPGETTTRWVTAKEAAGKVVRTTAAKVNNGHNVLVKTQQDGNTLVTLFSLKTGLPLTEAVTVPGTTGTSRRLENQLTPSVASGMLRRLDTEVQTIRKILINVERDYIDLPSGYEIFKNKTDIEIRRLLAMQKGMDLTYVIQRAVGKLVANPSPMGNSPNPGDKSNDTNSPVVPTQSTDSDYKNVRDLLPIKPLPPTLAVENPNKESYKKNDIVTTRDGKTYRVKGITTKNGVRGYQAVEIQIKK